jgi:hypothetical protein
VLGPLLVGVLLGQLLVGPLPLALGDRLIQRGLGPLDPPVLVYRLGDMPTPVRACPKSVDLGLRANSMSGQILFEHLDADLGGRAPSGHLPTPLTLGAITVEQRLPLLLLFLLTVATTLAHRLSIRATGSAFGLQLGDRLLDARRPRPWIDQFLGHLITAPARPIQVVLGSIGGRMLGRRSRGQLPRLLGVDLGLLGGGPAQPVFGAVGAQ